MIGPGNVITNNARAGISIYEEEAVSNHVTQNSIYNNGNAGIALWFGGNKQLAAPVVYDFNQQTGILTGATYAGCTVEVFSDNDDEGEFYEGTVMANAQGIFTFNKGASFTYPRLTATATDGNGNTSQFSLATVELPARTAVLQSGNNLAKTQIIYKRSEELEQNRIGTFWGGISPWDSIIEWNERWVFDLGLKYARVTFNAIEYVNPNWDWPELEVFQARDEHINNLVEHGVTVNYVLTFWDVANHPQGWNVPGDYTRFQTEEEIQRYLEYVQFIVNQLKDRVQYYELWNEPDNNGIPVQHIKLSDYINLVKRVVPVIRQEYPEAKICIPSAIFRNPLGYEMITNLVKLDDIMTIVDVICWHPLYNDSPAQRQDGIEHYYQYPELFQAIKDTAYAHGFRGEFRADELTWYDIPPDPYWLPHSIAQKTKYYARGIMMHLGMDMTTIISSPHYLDPSFITIRNMCTIMAGAAPDTISHQIEGDVPIIKSYGFSNSNGEKFIAFWNDGVAVDDDPGIQATVTFPGFPNQKMKVIDVYESVQQELITEYQDGNLIIPDLLIKDYPIIVSTNINSVGILSEKQQVPAIYKLENNYPNPFNPFTTIEYSVQKTGNVKILIYNTMGQLVRTLLNEQKSIGEHSIIWDGCNDQGRSVATGIYYYQIQAKDFISTKKMLLLK
jgi:hypothetical protein